MDFLKDAVGKTTAGAYGQGHGDDGQHHQNYNDSSLRQDQSYSSHHGSQSFNDQSSQSDRTGTGLQNVGDHILNFLDGGASERERREREEAERLARETEERKKREREQEGFIGKVKDMFDGGADADRRRREEERARIEEEERNAGFTGKLTSLVGGGDTHQKDTGPKGFGDHINEALGGGRKAEKKEDFLDKGIDFVQQHFLGQGQQNDESAFEQAKDAQIANFVRGSTGIKKQE